MADYGHGSNLKGAPGLVYTQCASSCRTRRHTPPALAVLLPRGPPSFSSPCLDRVARPGKLTGRRELGTRHLAGRRPGSSSGQLGLPPNLKLISESPGAASHFISRLRILYSKNISFISRLRILFDKIGYCKSLDIRTFACDSSSIAALSVQLLLRSDQLPNFQPLCRLRRPCSCPSHRPLWQEPGVSPFRFHDAGRPNTGYVTSLVTASLWSRRRT